ncbi:MAG TPA: NapC/NirT family cytochrome c [Burkholderiales bacterium]|nr:NapC/NirT family cytochrome c [Burkholderiales bacterium]
MFGGWWKRLQQRCATCSRVTLGVGVAVVVLLVGAVIAIGGAAGLAWTERLDFCISCHEMRDNPYQEYKGTIHSVNKHGVRVVCADCHVPREVGPLLWAKFNATFELWDHFTGRINTRKKFLAHRAELATQVWTQMLETDSQTCRNCHKVDAFKDESKRAQAAHARMKTEAISCIDCHYAIAHDEPEGPGPQELRVKLGLTKK